MSYMQERSTFRLTSGLILALAVQTGLLLALKSGLVPHFSADRHITTAVFPVPSPVEPPPTPIARPNIDSGLITQVEPPPSVPVIIEEETPPLEPRVVMPKDEGGSGPSVAPTAAITRLRSDPRHPLTQPQYPPASIRQGETGTVTLLLYVFPDGRVGDARVATSSGFARLDAAAMREARRAWRFLPATSAGTAVGAWGTYSVTFRLTD
jgi:protein TonB